MLGSNSDRLKILLDYKGAAEALSLTEQALRDLVYKGRGPVVTKIGRRRMFAIMDLQEFVARHRGLLSPSDGFDAMPPHHRKPRKY